MTRKLYIAAAAGLFSLAASALGVSVKAEAAGDTVTQNLKPIVVNTWPFKEATATAWKALSGGASALDAVEAGCSQCEDLQCDGTVGFGGSPDEDGETTLDAMIMDGETSNVGAVANLRRVKHAASVARAVLNHTHHSILAGDQATKFAVQMGFKEETLETDHSKWLWMNWTMAACQPNFWTNVSPDPSTRCGPYTPVGRTSATVKPKFGQSGNHDTIGMVAIDSAGRMAAGTSTNGAAHKIPGRVGDSPIPGSGAYVDSTVGGAAATGDGDVMLRLLPSFVAVEGMRTGLVPEIAAQKAIDRVTAKYPDFVGAVVALDKDGNHGAACHGMALFPYSVAGAGSPDVVLFKVRCAQREEERSKSSPAMTEQEVPKIETL